MTRIQPNLTKLAEMTHYIIHKCQDKENFGKTVLFKLLYFSDFNYYKKNYEAISNEQYCKLEHGPAPRHFDKILQELSQEKKVGYNQNTKEMEKWVFKSLIKPTTDHLTKDELAEIDRVIDRIGHMNATQISTLSHEDNPYKASKLNEVISYGLVFYRKEEIESQVE